MWQFFSGLDYYEHRLPCDPTQIGRFRRNLGEDGLEQLLKATIDTAAAIKDVKPQEFERRQLRPAVLEAVGVGQECSIQGGLTDDEQLMSATVARTTLRVA